MRQRFESQPTNQRFHSLLWSSAINSKGLFIQALTYPFVLPAIAHAPPAIASDLPILQDLNADIYTAPTTAPTKDPLAATTIKLTPTAYTSEAALSASSQPFERLTAALVPPDALTIPQAYPTAAALALDPVESAVTPEPTVAIIARPLSGNIISSRATERLNEVVPLEEIEPSEEVSLIERIELEETELEEIEQLTETENLNIKIEAEETEFSWFSLGEFTQKIEAHKATDVAYNPTFITRTAPPRNSELDHVPILLAGPQDLNPGLSSPPEPLPSLIPGDADVTEESSENKFPPEPIPIAPPTSPDPQAMQNTDRPFIEWNDLEIGISNDFNNFGESSWSILPSLSGQLANGDTVGIASGFNQFEQTNFEAVAHTPLTLSWQGSVGNIGVSASGGVDLFNRLSADTHTGATVTVPLGQKANLSMSVEQAPYLFNAQTIENQISRWQYGPDLYWEISPKTTLFSQLRLGNYSDGNFEQQSFSRIERKIGEAGTVALNLVNQSFERKVEETSGYFSPRDFLVATAEMSWQEQIAKGFSCGASGSIGQQRLAGEWALAYSGKTSCTVDVAAALQVNFGYQFSNVSSDQSALLDDSAFSNQQITGGIRVRF